MPIDFTGHSCCGCSACAAVCPADAISMTTNEKGFVYPRTDPEKCVNCELCIKVCPVQEACTSRDADPQIFAAQNKDQTVLKASSSGGVMTSLFLDFLDHGGTVWGAAYDDDFTVRHCRASSKEETTLFRGSKYVQSDFSRVCKGVAEDLKKGGPVLVTGTPCQVSGLLKYLAAIRADTTHLYTCDNICHGVPSPMIWKDYLDIIRNRTGSEIASVNMRSKETNWEKQSFQLKLSSGKEPEIIKQFSYNELYLSSTGLRPSCFECKYTSFSRAADLTVADFWNFRQEKLPFAADGGVSEILVNTTKGQQLLSILKASCHIAPISRKAAWQPHLMYPIDKPGNYDRFWEAYGKAKSIPEKETLLRAASKGSAMKRIIRTVNPILRRIGLYTLAGKAYRAVCRKKSK